MVSLLGLDLTKNLSYFAVRLALARHWRTEKLIANRFPRLSFAPMDLTSTPLSVLAKHMTIQLLRPSRTIF